MSYDEGWLDELMKLEQSGAPPRRTAASSGRAASPPALSRPAARASPGASRPPRQAHRTAARRAPTRGTAGSTPTQAVRPPSPAAAAAGAAALARHQQAAGNAGLWPPLAPALPQDGSSAVFQPDPDIADFVLLDNDLAPSPATGSAGSARDVGPGAPDTAADELLARLLQKEEEEEMLIGLNDEAPTATSGFGRPHKELDPDLYAPVTYTADGAAAAAGLPPPLVPAPALPPRPAYATYAQEDNTLMDAYRDLNRRRGLDDRDDGGPDLLSFLPPFETGVSRAGQPARQVAQEECDLDAVDELDLGNLHRYSLRVLQEYCRLENVTVHGSTKQDYIKAIQAYNDDMMDDEDNDEDELSISELVERTQLEDLALDSDDERRRRLAREQAEILRLLPSPPSTTATATTSRDRASRPVIILDDDESESDKESESVGLGTARAPPSANQARGSWELTDDEMRALGLLSSPGSGSALILGDRDDDDDDGDDRHNPFYPHPLGAAPPQPPRQQRHVFDVPAVENAFPTALSEDEELERAIRESMLEHQRRQPQPRPQPQPQPGLVTGNAAAAGGTGDAAVMSDEELARALQEELDRSLSDERIARELQLQIEREEAESNNRTTRPVNDTTAMLMSMAERNRELREQTEALRRTLLQRQQQPPTAAAANRRGSASARAATRGGNEPAMAATSYFRRNFVEAQPQASRTARARVQEADSDDDDSDDDDDEDERRSTILLAAAAAAAATGGEPSVPVTRNRRRMPSRRDGHPDLLLNGAADLDNMSYEQLLALGERMGEAKAKGASQTTITSTTQTYRYRKPTSAAADSDNAKCSVCMDDFAEGDEVRMLPCIHAYHRACIDQWLVKKAACPVCQRPLEEEASS